MSNALLTMILLQVGAAPPPISFDLSKLEPSESSCSSGAGRDIVICAKRRSDRVVALPDAPEGLPKAEIGLFGNVRGSMYVQQNGVGGFPSNRVMATVKVPF